MALSMNLATSECKLRLTQAAQCQCFSSANITCVTTAFDNMSISPANTVTTVTSKPLPSACAVTTPDNNSQSAHFTSSVLVHRFPGAPHVKLPPPLVSYEDDEVLWDGKRATDECSMIVLEENDDVCDKQVHRTQVKSHKQENTQLISASVHGSVQNLVQGSVADIVEESCIDTNTTNSDQHVASVGSSSDSADSKPDLIHKQHSNVHTTKQPMTSRDNVLPVCVNHQCEKPLVTEMPQQSASFDDVDSAHKRSKCNTNTEINVFAPINIKQNQRSKSLNNIEHQRFIQQHKSSVTHQRHIQQRSQEVANGEMKRRTASAAPCHSLLDSHQTVPMSSATATLLEEIEAAFQARSSQEVHEVEKSSIDTEISSYEETLHTIMAVNRYMAGGNYDEHTSA